MLFRYPDKHMHMIYHHMPIGNFNFFVITKLSYYFSHFRTALPMQHFSPVLGSENHLVPAQPFRMCQFCSFAIKKHLFDVDGSLNNSVLSKRCFLGITVLCSTRLAGVLLFSAVSTSSTA